MTPTYYRVHKEGSDRYYLTTRFYHTPGAWHCECRGYERRGYCPHVVFAQFLANHGLNGWGGKDDPFDVVIPTDWFARYQKGEYENLYPPTTTSTRR